MRSGANDALLRVLRGSKRTAALWTEFRALRDIRDRSPSPEPVRVAETVTDAWESLSTDGGALSTVEDGLVYADPAWFDHLFTALLQNAVDHVGPDVTVRVGILDGRDGFYVADDGPGIAPEHRETVFERGYTTADDGTGFGLRIARHVVDEHGWDLSLADAADGGARFEVRTGDVGVLRSDGA